MAAITPTDLKPFLDQYKKLYLENYALRVVLSKREDWDDEQVNQEKARHSQSVEALFSHFYKLLDDPRKLVDAFLSLPS